MKTTEILEIYDTLLTKLQAEHIEYSIAMREWHNRKEQLKPTESAFDEPLFHDFEMARGRYEKAEGALTAFKNHDWR